MKNKTDTRRVGYDKSKRKAIKYGTIPWAFTKSENLIQKIDEQIKKSLYKWIMHHPQF